MFYILNIRESKIYSFNYFHLIYSYLLFYAGLLFRTLVTDPILYFYVLVLVLWLVLIIMTCQIRGVINRNRIFPLNVTQICMICSLFSFCWNLITEASFTHKYFCVRLFVIIFLFSVFQEFPAVSALELLVRANITVKSSIKHLVLMDAAAQVHGTPQSIKHDPK